VYVSHDPFDAVTGLAVAAPSERAILDLLQP